MPLIVLRSGIPAITSLVFAALTASAATPPVSESADRPHVLHADERGNTVPDFSRAGYRGGGVVLPVAATVRQLAPSEKSEDDGIRIQQALDEIASLPADSDGRRGALLLRRGTYRVTGSLQVDAGVVLRGEGSGENDGTLIVATGTERRPLIIVGAPGFSRPASVIGTTPAHTGSAEVEGTSRRVVDGYVPWSGRTLTLEHIDRLSVGDRVVVFRPGTGEWIAALGMDRIKRSPDNPPESGRKLHQWKPAEYDFPMERFITAIDHAENRVTLDAPLMIALDEKFGGARLYRAESRRAAEGGVESLRLAAEYKPGQETSDRDHAEIGVLFRASENAWARDVVALHFNLGFVTEHTAIFTTITDSALLDPVGPIRGGHRYGFNLRGQYGLVENCRVRNARHAFSTSFRTRGPNVFLDGEAELSHTDSGPHERFALGALYDNIRESGDLIVQNRGDWGTGHGWAGAQQVFWNCTVGGVIVLQRPPTAQNYAIGCIGEFADGRLPGMPRGLVESPGKHVFPASLYRAQLAARTSGAAKPDAAALSDR